MSGLTKTPILEAGGPRPVVRRLVSSKGCEKESDAFVLASDELLAIFGVPWLVEASPRLLPLSSPGILPT